MEVGLLDYENNFCFLVGQFKCEKTDQAPFGSCFPVLLIGNLATSFSLLQSV